MFGNTAVFLLVALAAERYVAVVHPLSLHQRRVSPFTRSVCCVLLTWTLATLLAVPDIFAHSMEDLVFTEDGAGMFFAEAMYFKTSAWALSYRPNGRQIAIYLINKKLSYRRETARQLHTSFSAHSLIVHFTEHRICFTTI